MVSLEDIIDCIISELEETDSSIISSNTRFRDLEEWSSLFAINIMNVICQRYSCRLDLFDLVECETIEDLYTVVLKCKNKTPQTYIDVNWDI